MILTISSLVEVVIFTKYSPGVKSDTLTIVREPFALFTQVPVVE